MDRAVTSFLNLQDSLQTPPTPWQVEQLNWLHTEILALEARVPDNWRDMYRAKNRLLGVPLVMP